jgi:hypothetical protein
MRRSRAALVVGLLVVLVAFAYGVENRASTTVAGQRVDCGSAISASWLVSGTDSTRIAVLVTASESDVMAACDTVVQRARIGVLSTMTAGALLALVGWTAMREGRGPRRAGRPEVRSA